MNRWLARSYLTLVYSLLYLPILIVVWFSFNNAPHSLIWHGFSLRWYRLLFHDTDLGIITLHSLLLALTTAILATSIGSLAAISFYRYRFVGKSLFQLSIFILVIIPDLVLGIALLLLFSFSHLPLGFWSLLLAHVTMTVPFASLLISNRLRLLDKNIINAGLDLGANELVLYRYILIPLLWPVMLASGLLCFTLSLDDVIISYFVSGPNFEILPLKIFSMVKLGIKPEINALCSIILLATIVATIISQIILRRRQCNVG